MFKLQGGIGFCYVQEDVNVLGAHVPDFGVSAVYIWVIFRQRYLLLTGPVDKAFASFRAFDGYKRSLCCCGEFNSHSMSRYYLGITLVVKYGLL